MILLNIRVMGHGNIEQRESNMELQEKIEAIAEMLDVEEDEFEVSTRLEDIEEWDSLAALSYVVFMSDNFNRNMSAKDIRAFETVQDIVNTME